MPKRLLLLNLLVLAVSAVAIVYISDELTEPAARPLVRERPASPTSPAPAPEVPAPVPSPTVATAIVQKNLFSPTRTETASVAAAAPVRAAPPPVKPTVFGIVLREGAPVAYLEDPATKRVAGYRLGDSIAGGTIKSIAADTVVLARPDGAIDLQLRDPSKPRPAPTPAAAAPGQRPQPGAPQAQAPAQVPPAGVAAPPTPAVPRRPLPPNLLRRLPSTSGDATQQ